MKLLIITQKVHKNDQILGFFHAWLEEFSEQVEQLTVICLEEGLHSLPQNTKVYSLGKERGTSKLQQLQLATKYVVELQDEYDAVFVHMNPIYVVLFGLYWKMSKKPVFLWYMHKHVDTKLRIAEKFVQTIFTGSKQSLRLETQKKMITGHGIDTDFFIPNGVAHTDEQKNILTVGRVSSAKKTLEIIQAIKDVPNVILHIVGGAVTKKDLLYLKSCTTFVAEHSLEERVLFHGPVTHNKTREYYQQADLFVNISTTGSLDKVLLEALSCETPVITSNDSGKDIEGVRYFNESQDNLTEQINAFLAADEEQSAREYVINNHGLSRLIKKIVERINKSLK